MVSYKEFLADAISNYGSLPSEANPLYKKYVLEVPLEFESEQGIDMAKHEAMINSVSGEITQKTMIKFDAIISEHMVKSFSSDIKIMKPEDIDEKFISDKIFKSSEDKLAAFSNANAKYFIIIEAKEGKKENVNILFMNGSSLAAQVIVKAEKGSRLTVFELCVSEKNKKGTVSVLHEITANSQSEVEINVLHNESADTNIINLCKGKAMDDAKLKANFIYTGGLLTKSKNIMESSGIDSQIDVSEFAFGNGEQRFDLGTSMWNSSPKSTARLESGTVLDGKSQCMLKGYAKVEKGTKGCFSRITERGILLSKDAHVDALPDMSIDYSNEVKATHSAATAPIDKESLFYLQSRGLTEEHSRKIFITAFLAKYVSNMSSGVAHEVAMSIMLEKLETGSFGLIPDVTARGAWALK